MVENHKDILLVVEDDIWFGQMSKGSFDQRVQRQHTLLTPRVFFVYIIICVTGKVYRGVCRGDCVLAHSCGLQ